MSNSHQRRVLGIGFGVILLMFVVYLVVFTPQSGIPIEDGTDLKQTSKSENVLSYSESSTEQNDFFERNPSVAWIDTSGTKVDERLIPSYKEEVEGSALVEISHLLDRLEKGDTLHLTVPQESHTYKTSVDEVKRALGVASYSGRVVEGENPLSFLITVGQNSVFANFSTPHASYELWGNRRYGLLMDYANIDQGVDYSKPDYYLPEERFEFE